MVAERLMAQSAPKVCAARVWRQGFVSSDSLVFTPSQLWHVKCMSEVDLPWKSGELF